MEEGTDGAPSSSQHQQQQEQQGGGDQHNTSTPGPPAPPAPPAQAEDEASDAASALAGLAIASTGDGAEGEEGGGEGSIAAALDTSQDGPPPNTTDDNDNTTTAPSTSSSQPAQPPPSSPAATAPNTGKVKVQLMAVGRAPRLAQSKFIVQAKDSFRALFPVLRRLLQLREDQALFVFVNSAFAPAPEEKFGDLFQCFGKTGTLIVNYSLDEAWG